MYVYINYSLSYEKYCSLKIISISSDDYIAAANKLRCLKSNNNDYYYKLLMQENDTIIPCNGTDWDIDR